MTAAPRRPDDAETVAGAPGDPGAPGAPGAPADQREAERRAAAQMRSLAEITPAVAHDLRAPINAMVLNLEVLKSTLAASVAGPHNPRDPRDPRNRQQRYVQVLGDELKRLHQELEIYLAHISPRGDREETVDLRALVQDLASMLRPPARKQLLQIELVAPDEPVQVTAPPSLVRQALLHVGLAALRQVPREGTLQIKLERHTGRGRVRFVANSLVAAADQPAAPLAASTAPTALTAPTAPPTPTALAPPSALTPATPPDTRLEVAERILDRLGGSLHECDAPPGTAGPRRPSVFEIELPLSVIH